MSVYKTILDDLAAAMKSQQEPQRGVLRMLKASLLNAQKESGASQELSDEQVLTIIAKEAKKRKESIAAFTEGGRDDLVAQEEAELTVLEAYLPAQLTDEEIRAEVDAIIAAQDNPQFGAIMGQAMKALQGKADGNRVKEVVQQALQ